MSRLIKDVVACALVMAIIVVGGGVGCDSNTPDHNNNVFLQLEEKAQTKIVAAATYPLLALAKLIAGDELEVWMPKKSNAVPNTQELQKLQRSDLLLTNGPGAGYATWLPMVTLDRDKIFETTTDSFELSDFVSVAEHQIVHSHGSEGTHSHAWMVPHCWLNVRLARLQAEALRDKLCEFYPQHTEKFRQNYQRLVQQPLTEAAAVVAQCRELIKINDTQLLLSDPRLKHLVNAIGGDANYLLWFDSPPEAEAQKQWQQTVAINKAPAVDGHKLLLWARSWTAEERLLTSGWNGVQIDLIETPYAERGLIDRVKENYKKLASALRPENGTEQ